MFSVYANFDHSRPEHLSGRPFLSLTNFTKVGPTPGGFSHPYAYKKNSKSVPS